MPEEIAIYSTEEYDEVAREMWNIMGGIPTESQGWEVITARFMNENFMSIADHIGMTAKGY